MRSVYFDYNATTPLDPEVRAAMLPFLTETWGNPSSIHHIGRRARAFLDEARERTARVLGCKPSEVVFTAGGTESVNLALMGTARALKFKGRHLITSAVEHHAVLHCLEYLAASEGFELTCLPVDREGRVAPDSLERALREDTILVSIMAANNEVGTIQPVDKLGEICREKGVVFHTDAVQWFGKEPFEQISQFNADLVSICAHKLHGPKGAGVLFIRSPLRPHPILFGGAHENEHRAGTESLAAILGLTEALELFVRQPVFPAAPLLKMTKRFRELTRDIEGLHFVGSLQFQLSNTIALVADRSDSIALLAGLDLEGICASSGSACSAGSLEPSHVVKALGFTDAQARALLRFSLGRESTMEQVEYTANVLPEIIRRTRSA